MKQIVLVLYLAATGASLSAQNPVLRTNNGAQKFFGTAPPGAVAGNLPGDLFTDSTNHNEYVCNAPLGTSAPACTSVTTTEWMLLNGGGGSVAGLLLSGPGDPSTPTVSVVQHRHGGNSLAFNSNVTVGDLLIVVAGKNSGLGNPPNISDTLANSWTQAFYKAGVGGYPNQVSLLYAVANATGATTISVTDADELLIAELTGSVSASVDITGTSNASPISFPSVVTTQGYDLLVSALITDIASGLTVTAPEVIIESYGTPYNMALSWVLKPSIGSVASTLYQDSTANTAYGSSAFKTQPPTSPGNNGDWFLNMTTGKLWGPKTAGIWSPSGFTFTP